MGQFSRQEVAERAGVDPDYVDRLVELGILRPGSGTTFSPGDVRRARWVQSFERAGVPLDGMATAVRDGALSFSYLDATAFDRFAGASRTTFRELSERTGVPMDLLLVVREAHGFAEPRPEDHVREDELALVPAMDLLLSFGIRPEAIKRLLRAYGDGLGRIVETETDWYRTEVELPLLEGGMTEVEMLAAQADVGSQITPFLDQAVLSIYHGQQEHAWSKSAVEDVEGALERAGLYRRVRRPPAVSFLDISGYTRLTEERGDEAAAELATTLAALVRGSSREHGGQPVKWLGDGVMFYFPNPGDGVLLRPDRQHRVADRRVRQTRRGAGEPGGRGCDGPQRPKRHRHRSDRTEGRLATAEPAFGAPARLTASACISWPASPGRHHVTSRIAPRRRR